jgi:ribosomal-protein-serine acetyltransferase
MTRCCRALIAIAFSRYGQKSIVINAGTGNKPSRAVAERLGFKNDGVLRQYGVDAAGGLHDFAVYSLLRDEWKP